MDAYCIEVRKLDKNILRLEFHHLEREFNVAADVLSKLGSSGAKVPCGVFVNELAMPSINDRAGPTVDAIPKVMITDVPWTQPLTDYIRDEILPEEKHGAERIVWWSKLYIIVGNTLYKCSAQSNILLKCVSREEGLAIL